VKALGDFDRSGVRFLFTDIDDTLTDNGKLPSDAYEMLWRLNDRGLRIIPVTGRPAGWCEMIARFWPVEATVGENGAFYFRYHQGQMKRHFMVDGQTRLQHRRTLDQVIAPEILRDVPGTDIASDQFCRLSDLAIDYCEDVVPLPSEAVERIVRAFERHGAQARISSIHVNGWFGDFNKLSTCQILLQNEFGLIASSAQDQIAFVGDSPNDEPMFEFFENSFAVANIRAFSERLESKPAYVASSNASRGFREIAERLLSLST